MNRIRLAEHINKYVGLNPREEKILQSFVLSSFHNQFDFLLRKNQVCHSLYFVNSGCLRMYLHDQHAREQIIQFAIEGWWITDFASFLNNLPSDYSIQATEKTEIIRLDKNKYENLNKEVPQMEQYFNKMMQINLAATQTKNKYLHTMSKGELYHHFSSSFPDFIKRVPKSMVESYLGISIHK